MHRYLYAHGAVLVGLRLCVLDAIGLDMARELWQDTYEPTHDLLGNTVK